MNLLFKSPQGSGLLPVCSPQNAPLKWLQFSLLRLTEGQAFAEVVQGAEACLVVLSGTCRLQVDSFVWENVGGRKDVFSGKASALYVPPEWQFRIEAKTPLEVAVIKAEAKIQGEPVLITQEDVKTRTAGKLNWRREIDDIITSDFPAQRLLVGETRNPPGNWSSYPPHKHDENNPPHEVMLEEVYHFRLAPPQGFGLQRVYTADGNKDEVYTVRDGDTVVLPKGYHPVAAAPGYRLYYLWALAGESRQMLITFDPKHAWVLAAEALVE